MKFTAFLKAYSWLFGLALAVAFFGFGLPALISGSTPEILVALAAIPVVIWLVLVLLVQPLFKKLFQKSVKTNP